MGQLTESSSCEAVATPVPGRGAAPPADVPAEEARAELDRVLAADSLRDSGLLKRFLQYVVEQTLAGKADRLKEYRLAVDVFERPASFDPRLDPVVRMAAGRLRRKLQDYYETGGRGNPLRIDIPKGAYSAVFTTLVPAPGAGQVSPDAPREPGSSAASGVPSDGRPTALDWRRPAVVVLAALLTLAAAAGGWRYFRHAQATPPSLVVLPFLNLTGNPDDDYLSDGLTDEITSAVGRIPGLRVVARTSAFKFKGKAVDVRDIGSQLGVASVLEGGVQTQADHLRITAQLVRTSDGYHLWSQTYERPFKDVFAVEDEIAGALSSALRIALATVPAGGSKQHDVDPVAHELYLRGRYLAMRTSEENARKSMTYFNQALDRDPMYAPAYAGLASAWAVLGADAWAPAAEVYPQARAAAQRAVALEDNLPEAHAILANITFMYDWDPVRAEQEFKRALELNPNNAAARQWYGIMLHFTGRFEESLEQFKRAKESDPLPLGIDIATVMLYQSAGDLPAAIALDRKALSTNSNHPLPHLLLGSLYADQNNYEDAIREVQKALVLAGNDDPEISLFLGQVYARSGQREKAMSILKDVLSRKSRFVPPYTVAGLYATLGDEDGMYEWLNKAVDQRSPACLQLNLLRTPFTPYRSEPRFQEVLRRTGLGG
jgi:TolB-like protein/Tfp pilus assembly protein PilF